MGDCVGISRILRAAMSYFAKASIRRFRTLDASASWSGVGGLSGSCRMLSSFWNRGSNALIPLSNCRRLR